MATSALYAMTTSALDAATSCSVTSEAAGAANAAEAATSTPRARWRTRMRMETSWELVPEAVHQVAARHSHPSHRRLEPHLEETGHGTAIQTRRPEAGAFDPRAQRIAIEVRSGTDRLEGAHVQAAALVHHHLELDANG